MNEHFRLINNRLRNQYEFQINGKLARIEYIKSDNGEIYLIHTDIPSEFRTQDVWPQLIEKIFKDIESQGLRLIPLCFFVTGYILKFPEWNRIIMSGIHIR